MPVVDIHTHAFPDRLAGPAMATLVANAKVPPAYDGTVAGLLAAMDRGGVDRAVVQPVATKPDSVAAINDWAAGLDGRVTAFGAMHPDLEGAAQEVARMRALGLRGFKLHPEFQRLRPDERRMVPLYEAAIEHDMIVFFHAGLDLAIPTVNSTPPMFAGVLDRFPGLTMALAHFGGWKQWDDVLRHLAGRDVYLDTAYTLGWIDPALFEGILAAHGSERVLFGSDGPWADQAVEVGRLRALGLPQPDLDAILGGNAERLLGRART